jgi:hypothetical protein
VFIYTEINEAEVNRRTPNDVSSLASVLILDEYIAYDSKIVPMKGHICGYSAQVSKRLVNRCTGLNAEMTRRLNTLSAELGSLTMNHIKADLTDKIGFSCLRIHDLDTQMIREYLDTCYLA